MQSNYLKWSSKKGYEITEQNNSEGTIKARHENDYKTIINLKQSQ